MSLFGVIRDAITGMTATVTAGGLDVNTQDQTTRTGDIFLSQIVGVTGTLGAATAIDDWDIDMVAGHGITVGDQLVISDSVSNRLYIGDVLVVTVNNIELDTPINFIYPTATTAVIRSTKKLNVDGSVTRQTFSIAPPTDVEIDITRVMFQMTTNDLPEMDMFGDIAGGLTRGLVLRSVNGETVNYFNVKTNGELVNIMYDVNFIDGTKQGVNGLGGRLTYGGQSKHGAVIRLGQGDSLEAIIQDDLTGLLSFRMMATFHIVQ